MNNIHHKFPVHQAVPYSTPPTPLPCTPFCPLFQCFSPSYDEGNPSSRSRWRTPFLVMHKDKGMKSEPPRLARSSSFFAWSFCSWTPVVVALSTTPPPPPPAPLRIAGFFVFFLAFPTRPWSIMDFGGRDCSCRENINQLMIPWSPRAHRLRKGVTTWWSSTVGFVRII